MFLWRISNYASLEGAGGLLAPARWHNAGNPIVYLAESPSGALTEILVHLDLQTSRFPTAYKLLKVESPDDLPLHSVAEKELPADWRRDAAVTRNVGDEWLLARSTALLRVPSAIAPETWNVLLNPRHPGTPRMKILWHREYPWDERLLK